MAECLNCEYHKNRAARWRAEAYKQAGHDVIELPWVGLTMEEIWDSTHGLTRIQKDDWVATDADLIEFAHIVEAKLKEKNGG